MRIESMRRQSMISLTTTIALTIIGFMSTMYFAHVVGESVLGAYFLFVAYFSIFNLVGDAGFGGAVVKRISEGREQNEFFSAFVTLRVILLTVSVSALLLVRPMLVDIDTSGMFFWLLMALVIGVFSSIVGNGNYGSGKVGVHQTCGFLNIAGRVIFQVVAVFLGFGAAGLAGGFVFGMIAGGIVGLRFLDLRFARFEMHHLKSLFSFSFWIFLSAGGSLVFSYADTVLIGYFMENADVGVYRIAFQFTTAATFTTVAMRTVLFPNMSKWSAHNEYNKLTSALTKGFTYSLLLAVPVLIGGLLLGDRLLYFCYGAGFVRGAPALYLLLAAQVVNVFMYLQTMGLLALDRPKESFKVAAVAATANILLNLTLIPRLGITGAAVATLLTMTLNAVLAYRVLKKIIVVRLEYSSVKNILISSAVMGVFVGGYRLVVPLSSVWLTLIPVLVGGIIYGAILLKLDTNIFNELRDILLKMGIVWPRWL
jgi:O-antigen/teichoic acid export membrane protein